MANKLRVKRLTETATLPTRANPDDAGLDLYADETVEIPHFGRATVQTGIAISVDSGYVGLIWPRSGLASKKGISRDAGVIDASYRGPVAVVVTNGTPHRYTVRAGDRIAQLLVQPVDLAEVVEVDSLDETSRGADGFGSTGT
jgi:deoxyuridine 5'-triphosphate nucleotidohydrolase